MIHSSGLLTQSSACRTISERSLPLRILGMSNVVATESFSITMERKCLCPLIVTHGPDQVLCLRRDLPHSGQWVNDRVDVDKIIQNLLWIREEGVTAKSYLSDFGTNWLPKSVLSSRYMPFKSLAEKTPGPNLISLQPARGANLGEATESGKTRHKTNCTYLLPRICDDWSSTPSMHLIIMLANFCFLVLSVTLASVFCHLFSWLCWTNLAFVSLIASCTHLHAYVLTIGF